MRIVLAGRSGERELLVRADAPDATLADVLAAAGVPVPEVVHVEGRAVPTDHTLAECAVPDGATVRLDGAAASPALLDGPPRPVPTLAVVAGASAGTSVELRGAVVVGRGPDCDLVLSSTTVSDTHCRVVADGRGSVTVTDLGSMNGTWIDGEAVSGRGGRTVPIGAVIRCGATVLRVEPAVEEDRPRSIDPLRHLTPAGTIPFNRPPRPGSPPPVPPVHELADAPDESDRPVFSLVAMLAPMAMAGMMVAVMGSIRFAMFALLTPVMLLANTVAGRRRAARQDRTANAEHRAEVLRFAAEVRDRARAETSRRWELLPSLAETQRRALQPSTRLWERRRADEDQLLLSAGVGPVPFAPALRTADGRPATPTAPAAEVLEAYDRLPDSPVEVDLSRGGVVGIVGARGAAAGLARSLLLQACVHHGPADLPVAVVADEHRLGDWGWATWLPHVRRADGGGDRARLALTGDDADALLRGMLEDAAAADERAAGGGLAAMAARAPVTRSAEGDDRPAAPTLLVVLDAPSMLRGREAPARSVLRGDAGPVCGIVLAPTADDLPAVCDTVITLASEDGEATVVRPAQRVAVPDVLVAAVGEPAARRTARRLAGFEDPELTGGASQLPGRVELLDLLGRDAAGEEGIRRRWAATAGDPRLSTPVGVGAEGTVELDLVRDGPHGLLGGTTGSGKSELLRSLVAGLAVRHDPDHLTFVLVDYKGGAAFDVCADLPHVVGLVTDLDEHLGERALRCLEAELEHRERRLRAAGVSDLPQWLRLPADQRGEPLPRLLVVVDEFATLKAELPDFVSALVGIAQRGRSLGVHMLLGTQRPSGAVDENVRANSNLRIALRVTDTHDSSDVVGVPDAAHIPPSLPGRGVVRVGPGAVLPLQTALVTGRSGAAGPRVAVGPVTFGPTTALPTAAGPSDDGPSDLDRLVDACRAAFAEGDHPTPRRPWPEPLPHELPLAALLEHAREGDSRLPVALVDVPEEQAQHGATWDLEAGNLLLHGVVGSGTTTTALACVLAAATLHAPDALHMHVLDLGRGDLQVLEGLPHVGAVVSGREDERRRRLLQHWFAEAERRRGMDRAALDACARQLVVIDGLESLLAELDDPATYDVADALLRVLSDAPSLRMSAVLTTTRAGGLRASLTSTIEQRWTHRLADPADYGLLGLRPADVPALGPGRVVRTSDGRQMQVGRVADVPATVAALASRWGRPSVPPSPVLTLPDTVSVDELLPGLVVGDRAWRLPVGRRERDLALASLLLHTGEHGVLFGGPGSGRTGVLGALAAAASRSGELDVVVCAGSASSPLLADGHDVVAPGELGAMLTEARLAARPTLVLVDDAERVADPGAALEALAGDGMRVHLVVAARAEVVQADFGHWVRRAARGRVGGFLRPVGDVAGDLLGARLPRRTPARVTAGRGWLVAAGAIDFVQLAQPDGRVES